MEDMQSPGKVYNTVWTLKHSMQNGMPAESETTGKRRTDGKNILQLLDQCENAFHLGEGD